MTTEPGRSGTGRLLTAEEVGDLLSVKPSWVYAEARAQRIPHVRLGRYVRFNAASIATWVEERERGPAGRASTTRWEAPRRLEA